jgi:ABC-2 type transport system permease protein
MNASIVPQLIKKDLQLMKVPALCWWFGGLASVALMITPGAFLFGMILFVTCLAGSGMHAVTQTVVEERREHSLPFIMSLPITVREYTLAKMVANLGMFSAIWVTLSAVSLVIFLGSEGLPNGSLPFRVIVLVGIFLAYTIVLAASLVTQSIGGAITSIVGANIVTQLFLWWVADLEGIKTVIEGDVAVWNGTAVTVLVSQLTAIVALLAATYALQVRKTDFI